jgi:nucleotide-binding universal stress UspA family protein
MLRTSRSESAALPTPRVKRIEQADAMDDSPVLGSRGLTGVRELVEGSLSHQGAEHARRPVLVVPPNEPPLS